MIRLLRSRTSESNPPEVSLLDESTPEIDVPVLRPEIVKAKPKEVEKVVKDSIDISNDWLDWLKTVPENRISLTPELEAFRQRINELYQEFEIIRGRSALREFTTLDIIEGREGYDPQSFFKAVKRKVTDFFKHNRNIKVKMVLNCEMILEKPEGKIIEPKSFHSRVETNFEGTNVQEMFNTMVARILENIATFQQGGSQWVFYLIENLETYSVE